MDFSRTLRAGCTGRTRRRVPGLALTARGAVSLGGLLGGVILVVYGILPTLQPASFNFARTYATYGGLFIVFSLLWGRVVEHRSLNAPSLWGAALALTGALIIAYWPRT